MPITFPIIVLSFFNDRLLSLVCCSMVVCVDVVVPLWLLLPLEVHATIEIKSRTKNITESFLIIQKLYI